MLSRNMTDNVHQLIQMHILSRNEQDLIAVDATLGNGFDLEFLNGQKQIGTIYGFDIQEQALNVCKEKVSESSKTINLICDSHDQIDSYIEEAIDIAVFNLGYLPGGDKAVVTQTHSSLKAITKTIEKLNQQGLLAIMTYPGHEEGEREHEAIKDYLNTLQRPTLSILQLSVTNVKKRCPNLFLVIKN